MALPWLHLPINLTHSLWNSNIMLRWERQKKKKIHLDKKESKNKSPRSIFWKHHVCDSNNRFSVFSSLPALFLIWACFSSCKAIKQKRRAPQRESKPSRGFSGTVRKPSCVGLTFKRLIDPDNWILGVLLMIWIYYASCFRSFIHLQQLLYPSEGCIGCRA